MIAARARAGARRERAPPWSISPSSPVELRFVKVDYLGYTCGASATSHAPQAFAPSCALRLPWLLPRRRLLRARPTVGSAS